MENKFFDCQYRTNNNTNVNSILINKTNTFIEHNDFNYMFVMFYPDNNDIQVTDRISFGIKDIIVTLNIYLN